MNLLLITKDNNKHYVLIKDFNSFMYNQTKRKERKHFCIYCLQCFSSETILLNHVNNCLKINGKQAISMPKEGENILKFNNYNKQLPVPFVIYADFEAIMIPVEKTKEYECEDGSYTKDYQTHEDCGCGYIVVCCYEDKYSKLIQTYRGKDAVYVFMERMIEEVEYCKDIVNKHFNKPLIMTEDDDKRFELAKERHICDESTTKKTCV